MYTGKNDQSSTQVDELVNVSALAVAVEPSDSTKQPASLICKGQDHQQQMSEPLQLSKAGLSAFNGDPVNY
jgi:hypothetical protein